MKKIYALVAGLAFVGAVSAQTTEIISGGGFEGTFVTGAQVPALVGTLGGHTSNMQSLDWVGPGFSQAGTAITGSKSAKLTAVDDSTGAVAFWGAGSEPKTSGIAQQVYEGAFPVQDPNLMSFKFKYTYAPVGADTAFALVQLLDTNNTGNAQVLWQGAWAEWNAVSTATEATLATWQSTGSTGTINMAVIMFGTSLGNFYDDTPAPVGSALVLDDVSFSYTTVGLNEVSNATSKVYPNPTSDVLNIEVSKDAKSLNVYGIDGKVVLTTSLNGTQSTINVSNLNNGVYFYNITTIDGSVMNGSFIKE
ncbi:MAG TPA: T9SS type A sorting domain-containing protein [Crocinitomicaceae bacterium]|nr:T9SS type A sorting domain-containing protein [Crocinitomicaceae bacterium]